MKENFEENRNSDFTGENEINNFSYENNNNLNTEKTENYYDFNIENDENSGSDFISENDAIAEEIVKLNNEVNSENTDEKKSDGKSHSKREKNKKLTKKQKIKIALATMLAFFVFLGVVFGVYVYKANGNLAEAVLNVATDVLGDQDPIFVLVLGVSEDISTKLTDTIILCGYNPDSQKAFMLSIPRDTFVGKSEASANGFDKINALYQKDVEKTVAAVEKLTGVNIDNYVVVKNTALPAIVNAIGEVEFDVPIDMDYDDPTQDLHIHLKSGIQKIDGDKAEQLLRFRHNNDGSSYPYEYGDNDYGRMRTQRNFITAVAKKLITWESAANLKKITTAVFDNLETNMNLGNVLAYVPYGLKFNTETLRAEQLPGASAMINELWFYKANNSKTKELMDELIASLEMDDKENEKYYTRPIKKSDNKTTNTTKTNTVKDDDDYDATSSNKKTNKTKNTNSTSQSKVEENPKVCEHDYSIIVEERDSSCTEAGKSVRRCRICGDTVETQIKAKGHNYVNNVCTNCGNKEKTENNNSSDNTINTDDKTNQTQKPQNPTEQHKHQYNTEVSRVEPTCGTAGSVTKKCSCGDLQTTTLNPTGNHTYSEGICAVCNAKDPNYTEQQPTPPVNPPQPDVDPADPNPGDNSGGTEGDSQVVVSE